MTLAAVLVLSLLAGTPAADEAVLGRRLYEEGLGAGGEPVTAVLEAPEPGRAGVELPATVLPCAGCHGRDGRGRPEGGASPSDLRWASLTRPWDVTAPSGRVHASYDERRLVRAVTLGFDPSGHRLQPSMPRYRLSRTDAHVLVAYLATLGDRPSPGVYDDRLVVGVVTSAEPGPAERAALAVLRAWQADLGAAGGIHGRRPELREVPPSLESADELDVVVLVALQAVPASARAPIVLSPAVSCSACFEIPGGGSPDAPSRRFQELRRRHALPGHDLDVQLRTLAAAEILTAALEAAGRDLDPERLLRSLRSPGGFTTSIGPVRFSP